MQGLLPVFLPEDQQQQASQVGRGGAPGGQEPRQQGSLPAMVSRADGVPLRGCCFAGAGTHRLHEQSQHSCDTCQQENQGVLPVKNMYLMFLAIVVSED